MTPPLSVEDLRVAARAEAAAIHGVSFELAPISQDQMTALTPLRRAGGRAGPGG